AGDEGSWTSCSAGVLERAASDAAPAPGCRSRARSRGPWRRPGGRCTISASRHPCGRLPAHRPPGIMARQRSRALRVLSEFEAIVDWARHHARRARGGGPFRIEPYRGHGTRERLVLRGRVLEGEPIPPADEKDSAWRNLVHTLRRIESDEVPAARLRARMGGREWDTVADDEGYFLFDLDVSLPEGGPPWHPVELELLDPVAPDGVPVRATGYALVPPESARF